MADSKLVIVESPAKAKTINKYLGSDFTVLASFGHIRDLPPKDGSVRPDEDFAMDWELGERASRPVSEITRALKDADTLYLASDPDREGEAIAWHVKEELQKRNLLKGKKVHRITFNEITKPAVKAALESPRDLDKDLIDAYMARRALDYLVGFNLSPVLWRKLPGSRSAGRVQSVALRLICEREDEIEKFKPQEYWTILALFTTKSGEKIPARLFQFDGKKVEKFSFTSEKDAKAALDKLHTPGWSVGNIEHKQVRRNPYAPFTTSTLQMEASRKLGLSASRTMRTAQGLYEDGYITYMRTDGVTLSQEAINGARSVITAQYGKDYLPASPRLYTKVAKNAQEAHEAIRPTDISKLPADVSRSLEPDAARLYTLIWQRTVASQMENAVLDQVSVDITASNGSHLFRASGSVIVFDGFLRAYEDEKDDSAPSDAEDEQTRLPAVKTGDGLNKSNITPHQHFTEPPPRYSEASLIKKLEELGIGRPSTYVSIIQVLQDRNYVTLDKKRFIPEDRGRIVTAFLAKFFEHYVEYDFTADLEERLDDISAGKLDWKKLLREFWKDFSAAIGDTKDLKISDVIDALDEDLGPHFFVPTPENPNPRQCKVCGTGRLGLKLGKHGAFIGCSNYPECKFTMPLVVGGGDALQSEGPKELGKDPVTGQAVTLRSGPYGVYVQLDLPPSAAPPPEPEADEINPNTGKKKKKKKKPAGPKPKRASLPKGVDPNTVDLEKALSLLALPRDVGPDPETGEIIQAGIGRFGPYLKLGSTYKSIPKDEDVLTIGLNRAVVLIAEAIEKKKAMAGRELGNHPDDGKPITVATGRFGPFVKHGKTYANLSKDTKPENVTLEEALALLAKKAAKGKGPAAKEESAAPKAKGKAKKAAPKVEEKKKPAAKGKKKAA
ncbi:MAG TPA: type I DNA topoisomerase [Alphaproteobacteria bacterium]|nr:type I DNA topoisomerase [Alphaproteobacteria bacterium]